MTDEEIFEMIVDGLYARLKAELPDNEWPTPVHDAMALMCANRGEAWVEPGGWDKLVKAVDTIRNSEFNTSPFLLPSSLDLACATTASWLAQGREAAESDPPPLIE
jgi:hypothetical protein